MEYITFKEIEELNLDNIYLDFDETCVNSIDSVLVQLNRVYRTNYSMHDTKVWNMTDIFATIHGIEIEEIFDSHEFFDNLTWKDGVIDFIHRNHDKITIVTKGHSMNLFLKERWIKSYFPNIKFVGLDGVDMDKSVVDMGKNSVHIDDNEQNLRSTNAEYKILFENVVGADWNSKWEIDKGKYCIMRNGYSEKRYKMKNWLTD